MPRRSNEKYPKSKCKRWIYFLIAPKAPKDLTQIYYKALDLYFLVIRAGYTINDIEAYIESLKGNKGVSIPESAKAEKIETIKDSNVSIFNENDYRF